jgi:hypothetical protein
MPFTGAAAGRIIRGMKLRAAIYRAALLFAAGSCLCSCDRRTPAPIVEKRPTADSILREMIAAYRQAQWYGDRAFVFFSYRQRGIAHEGRARLSVQFQRSKQLALEAYQLRLWVNDGELHAVIDDEATNDFDRQELVQRVSSELTLEELQRDETVGAILSSGQAGFPRQLELLLSEAPLAEFFAEGAVRRLLSSDAIGEHVCQRVRVDVAGGAFVLWIDDPTRLLRRLEYPSEMLAARVAGGAAPTDLKLSVEYAGASFDEFDAKRDGRRQTNEGATLVSRFVSPPEPLPTKLFGEKLELPLLANQHGWADRVAVLAWYTHEPACRPTLKRLEAIANRFASDERIAFGAVCREEASVSDEEVQRRLEKWGCRLAILRDSRGDAAERLGLRESPALTVLDENGVLHVFQEGDNPYLEEELPVVLSELLAGKDIAALILEDERRRRAQYEAELAAAAVDARAPEGK